MPRRLRLARDDRYALPDQVVHQRRLTHIGVADDTHEATLVALWQGFTGEVL